MKAAQMIGPRQIKLIETPNTASIEGEVLVKVNKVSICGSDIRAFRAVLPEEQYPLSPGRPIHEVVGEVVTIASGEFNIGDQVIAFPYGQGGLKEYISIPPSALVLLPEQGSLDTWLMCQPLGTVLYSISRMGDLIDKNVVILGQGAIGLGFTRLLSGMNLRQLIAVDLEDYRLDLARELGASCTINSNCDDVLGKVRELTNGHGADVVVEAAGENLAVQQSVLLARKFGTVIWFGITTDPHFRFDFRYIRDNDLTIISTSSTRSGNMHRYVRHAVDMVHQNRIDPNFLITHKMVVDDIQKAFEMFESRSDGIIKVILDL